MILLLGLLAQMPPQTVLTIPAEYRLIEGVASDGETIWVSSILDRVIVEHNGGKFRAMPMPDGAGAPFAIAYDASRKWIWIAANCLEALKIKGCTGAWLVAMDRSGKVRRKVRPANDAAFTPGDVSVWQDQVFVSDTANGAVYRCQAACKTLTPLIARAGKRLLIVGDAQWSAHLPDKDGKVSGVQKPTPIVAIPAR